MSAYCFEYRCKLANCMCMMVYVVLGLIQGGQALQYTALTILNKIIDIATIHQIGLQKVAIESTVARHNSFSFCNVQLPSSHLPSSSCANLSRSTSPKNQLFRKDSFNRHTLGKKWAGMWKQTSSEKSPEEVPPEPSHILPVRQDCILGEYMYYVSCHCADPETNHCSRYFFFPFLIPHHSTS